MPHLEVAGVVRVEGVVDVSYNEVVVLGGGRERVIS